MWYNVEYASWYEHVDTRFFLFFFCTLFYFKKGIFYRNELFSESIFRTILNPVNETRKIRNRFYLKWKLVFYESSARKFAWHTVDRNVSGCVKITLLCGNWFESVILSVFLCGYDTLWLAWREYYLYNSGTFSANKKWFSFVR